MHASDLQASFPIVGRHASALEAARLIVSGGLVGLVIADDAGAPVAVVSAVDVLGLMVPAYVLDDVSLAGVLDERAAEEVWSHADEHTVGELLGEDGNRVDDLLEVDSDATLVEVAAQMAGARAQIALVTGGHGGAPVFVTLPSVMDAILKFCATPNQPQADA